MPASKAQIGVTYAVRRDGELTRFRVTKVTTHRVSNTGSPHDYESEITGVYSLDDGKSEVDTIDPRNLLGQFEEYEELVAKRDAEEKAKRIAQQQKEKDGRDLRELLYRFTGLPAPNSATEYHQAFRLSYGHSVDIDANGQAALLSALRRLKEREAA